MSSVTNKSSNKKGLSGGKVTLGNQVWKKFNIDYSTYDDKNFIQQIYCHWFD